MADVSESTIKHLEFLQSIVSRLANSSLIIKGWGTTLAIALLALAEKESDRTFAALATFPALAFWLLDAYYLKLERMHRSTYEVIARPAGLSISASLPRTTFAHAFCSPVTWLLYASLIFACIAVAYSQP